MSMGYSLLRNSTISASKGKKQVEMARSDVRDTTTKTFCHIPLLFICETNQMSSHLLRGGKSGVIVALMI